MSAERVFVPMRKAARMAVLYRADDEQKEKLLKKLQDFCTENHLRLVCFGYFDDKELQDYHIPNANSDFFCNKHLDVFKIPHKSEFLRFTSEKFDYLLAELAHDIPSWRASDIINATEMSDRSS